MSMAQVNADQYSRRSRVQLGRYKLENTDSVLGTKVLTDAPLYSSCSGRSACMETRSRKHLQCYISALSACSTACTPAKLIRTVAGASSADGQSNNGQASQSAAESSSSGTPRGIRWLDREVQHGNASEDKLVGAEGRPPIKTDRILRSYSKKERKPRRPWWRSALHALIGGTLVLAGVPIASAGIGVLLTCIRTGTLVTSCGLTYTGVKFTVAGTDQLRRAFNEDALPVERGTAARAWVVLIAATTCMSTTAALLPLFERSVRLYMRLVRLARGNADDLRFQLQSRKLMVNSAAQVERAARTVFGSEITAKVQEQIDAAMELAENMTDGLMADLASDEARRIVTALMFKLSLAYIVCGAVFLGPTFLNLLIAPRVARPLSRMPHRACARYKDWESWVSEKAGSRRGRFLAAAGQVVVILLAAKPVGLLGERLAALPTVHLKLNNGLFFLPDPPKVKVKPVTAVESDVSSSIPRMARWFLQ